MYAFVLYVYLTLYTYIRACMLTLVKQASTRCCLVRVPLGRLIITFCDQSYYKLWWHGVWCLRRLVSKPTKNFTT